MNLFEVVSPKMFKPLNSKYKKIYVDVLEIIYSTCKSEFSFSSDKEIIVEKLIYYFEEKYSDEIEFEEEGTSLIDPREKANGVIRELISCGWIEQEQYSDYTINISLFEHSATLIEAFMDIVSGEEMEYQSIISTIYNTLNSKEAYKNPYEFVIISVFNNTEDLIIGLKKLNTTIKKRIDNITRDKTPAEIIEDFFNYHTDVWSKAYHRIKTSDNISIFRTSILEKLRTILEDRDIFEASLNGYMTIENVSDRDEAVEALIEKIYAIISAFKQYDDIVDEIERKHTKYVNSAVSRAKFLLINSDSLEDKLKKILDMLAREFNSSGESLNEPASDMLMNIFTLFPQSSLDENSVRPPYIRKELGLVQDIIEDNGIDEDFIYEEKRRMKEALDNRYSKKNVCKFVEEVLGEQSRVLASTLALDDKRDFIRIVFIYLYGEYDNTVYHVKKKDNRVVVNGFRFNDFEIVRGK